MRRMPGACEVSAISSLDFLAATDDEEARLLAAGGALELEHIFAACVNNVDACTKSPSVNAAAPCSSLARPSGSACFLASRSAIFRKFLAELLVTPIASVAPSHCSAAPFVAESRSWEPLPPRNWRRNGERQAAFIDKGYVVAFMPAHLAFTLGNDGPPSVAKATPTQLRASRISASLMLWHGF
jgi:hypothetical protein